MKRLPLRLKITFWFTAALVIVVLLAYIVVLSISNQILQKTIKDNLIETVEDNFNDVKFYQSLDGVDLNRDASRFLDFSDGFLEIYDDFLDQFNEVYTSLYDTDGSLIYGENPIPQETSGLKFIDSRIQTTKAQGTNYYVFDRKLASKYSEGLWLRGVVSERQGTMQITAITRISFIILPILVVISSIGGYLLVKRTLLPIKKISETAKVIGQENNLKKRIEIGSGNDELHRLADTFNNMFDKLENAFETERRFISDASHELRTPMSVINAQCEFTLERPRPAEEYEDALRVIHRQGRKMSKLIGDMLDFTRLEVGTEKFVLESVDMTELVSSICSDMALIRENGVTLEYEAENGINLSGNHGLLSRLLMNLISNAYRYSKPNGHIWVSLKNENNRIKLSIADDGIGIKKDEQDKIFERFYQADNSRAGIGTGLGLSMASEIARFHNGMISVESEFGSGSTFTVIFKV